MQELVLYYRNTCPYCLRVKRFIEDNGINVIYKNLADDKAYSEELMNIGGKMQVPCLFVDGVPMYESMDIITWLEENVVDV